MFLRKLVPSSFPLTLSRLGGQERLNLKRQNATCEVCYVAPGELVLDDPNLCLVSAWKILLNHFEGYVVFPAQLMPVMPIDDNALPRHNLVSATLAKQTTFKSFQFLSAERRN